MLAPWKKSFDQSRQHIKKQRHYFANKGPSSWSYGFSSSQLWMWESDYKESWVPKNWCFWTVVFEKTLEGPLDSKEIKPVSPKGNQSWIFIEKTYWSWSSNALATWCQELTHWKRPWCWERLKAGRQGDNRDKTVGWHPRLNGHESEQALGDGEGQGSLACWSLRRCKELDTTEWLNNNKSRNNPNVHHMEY